MARIHSKVKVFDSRDVLVGEGWTFTSDTGRDADCVLIRWNDSNHDWCRYSREDFYADLDLQRYNAEFCATFDVHDIAVLLFVLWLLFLTIRRG